MDREIDFFRDEIRCGFYIPTAIKQAWWVQLNVLKEIDKVCKKHDIHYFANWGTLLGAVRHGGFVPWDDDLDIGMCREDYRRFREVADAELPAEYSIHDYERQEDHWLFLARVVNNKRICFDPDYLNAHHNFPWLIGIDIFIKDYLYDDPVKEKERDDEVMHIIAVADGIVEEKIPLAVKEKWLAEFEEKYNVVIDRTLDKRSIGVELYRLAEKQISRLTAKDSHTMGQVFPLIIKGHKALPPDYYEKVFSIPFENGSIPVTAGYNAFLASDYGDYLKLYKKGGSHGYPFFEGQKKEMMKDAGFSYPGYNYDPSTQKRDDPDEAYRSSLKGMTEECLIRFDELYDMICNRIFQWKSASEFLKKVSN